MKINPPPIFNIKNKSLREKKSLIDLSRDWWGINPTIFRAYDIRGIYPQEINPKTAFQIGQAFVNFLKKPRPKIGVGRDNRLSSPSLFKALSEGIIDQGGEVIDIGLATTPMLYFAVSHYQFDGGIEISASHLDSEFNGFKLVGQNGRSLSQKTGLKEIKKLIAKNNFPKRKKGKIFQKNIITDYLDFNLKDFKISTFKSLKLVFDTANAVPGILISQLRKKMPFSVFSLFEKLDGNFPNHPPNPLIKENLKFLQKEVKKRKADLGIAFDGDGDRIIFLDERGETIPGDLITAFISKLILKDYPGGKILYDIRSSNIVAETIEKAGGKPIVNQVGHSFIKERMRKEKAIFAGEFSGHYYHQNHYFSEAPLFVLFKILEQLSQGGKSFSQLIKPFQKYFHSGEINFRVKDKKTILRKLEKKFGQGKILKIDGLRINFKDWWFLVRPSNTEDILRLVIEAKTEKLMEKKKKELSSLIEKS